jgi:hypothetical protein
MTLLSLSTKRMLAYHSLRQDLSLPKWINVDINAAWHVAEERIGLRRDFSKLLISVDVASCSAKERRTNG